MEMIQHTFCERPEYIMDTQYGRITYRQWLELEAERIRKRPGRVAVIVPQGNGHIALWVDNKGELDSSKRARKWVMLDELVTRT